PPSGEIPAACTSASTRSGTSAARSASSRSAARGVISGEASAISARASRSRPTAVTRHPAAASCRATSRPIPLVAPVTRAVRELTWELSMVPVCLRDRSLASDLDQQQGGQPPVDGAGERVQGQAHPALAEHGVPEESGRAADREIDGQADALQQQAQHEDLREGLLVRGPEELGQEGHEEQRHLRRSEERRVGKAWRSRGWEEAA